jgi:hypothetical protein
LKISGEGAVTALTDVASKKKPDPSAEESAAGELVRLVGEQGSVPDRPGRAAQAVPSDRRIAGYPRLNPECMPGKPRSARKAGAMKSSFRRDEAGECRWNVVTANGEIVADHAEGYRHKGY